MNGPILTVTLNPAIDQTVQLRDLKIGTVNLAESSSNNAGGKGVNVASCLADWGTPVMATGFLGKSNSDAFEALFESKGILDRFLRVAGNTRTNIKLADTQKNETTDINLPGVQVSQADLDTLLERLNGLVEHGRFVVVAGSLPSGLAPEHVTQVIQHLNRLGAKVILDTSGAPLTAALAAEPDNLPFCIKPNQHELEQWAGKALPTQKDILDTARALIRRGIGKVVISMGEKGALFVDQYQALLASLPAVQAISTVGAGDALVAGLVSAMHQGNTAEQLARQAISFAVAKLGRIGPHLPDQATIQSLMKTVHIETVK